jgi:hypothetical protein
MRPAISMLARALLATLAFGCSHGQRVAVEPGPAEPSAIEPANEIERAILQRLPTLVPEQPVTIDGAIVSAAAPYHAASGRTCRSLTITGADHTAHSRLACREDAAWFFVPQVFQTDESRPPGADSSSVQ